MSKNHDRKCFVLQNVPDGYDRTLLKDYFEGTVDVDVDKIIVLPFIEKKALVILKNELPDFRSASEAIKNETLESQEIFLLEAFSRPAVVVTDIDFNLLEKQFLIHYLEFTFADQEDVVESCDAWPSLNVGVVHFSSQHQQVVNKVIETNDHVPLPSENYHVKIYPYFHNFHNFIKVLPTNNIIVQMPGVISSDKLDCDSQTLNQDETDESSSSPEVKSGSHSCKSASKVSHVDKDARKMKKKNETDSQESSNSDREESDRAANKCKSRIDLEDSPYEAYNMLTHSKNLHKINKGHRGRGWAKAKFLRPENQFSSNKGVTDVTGSHNRRPYHRQSSYRSQSSRGRVNYSAFSHESIDKTWDDYNTDGEAENYQDTNRHGFSEKGTKRDDKLLSRQEALRSIHTHDSTKKGRGLITRNTDTKHSSHHDLSISSVASMPKGHFSYREPNLKFQTSKANWRKKSTQRDYHNHSENDIETDGSQSRLHLISNKRGRYRSKGNEINDTCAEAKSSFEPENKFKRTSDFKSAEISKERQLDENICEQISMSALQNKCIKHYTQNIKDYFFYDQAKTVGILNGPKNIVDKWKLNILKEIGNIKETFIELSPELKTILASKKGELFLSDLNSKEFQTSFIELNINSLKVSAGDEVTLNETEKKIRIKLENSETITRKADIPQNKITDLINEIENLYLVKIQWNAQIGALKLVGLKDDIVVARKKVEIFLEEFGVFEKLFEEGLPKSKYFYSCLKEQTELLLAKVTIIQKLCTEKQITIRFHGTQAETNEAVQRLMALKDEIKITRLDLLKAFKKHELFLITNSLKNGIMKEVVDKYRYDRKCLIDTSYLPAVKLKASESVGQKPKKKPKSAVARPPKSPVRQNPEPQDKIIFSLSGTCKLIVKPYGNITKEKSDILVSVLGPDLDLRKTRVGLSFNKACRAHWKEVKAAHNINPGANVLIVQNPIGLKCKSVCHVVLGLWDPNTSGHLLISAIQQVLNQARLSGARSVSFPALGCGRAFQFPPSDAAQLMLQAFQSVNAGSFLSKLVILAPDASFFKEIKQSASGLTVLPTAVKPSVHVQKDESSDSSSDSSDNDDNDVLNVDIPTDDKKTSSSEVFIMAQHDNVIKDIKELLVKDIKEHCLHTDYYNQEFLKFCPKECRKRIIDEAKKLSVWIEKSPHPKTKFVGFVLTGEKGAVKEMKAFVSQEFVEASSHLPKKRMTSSKAPKRGTLEFLQYASVSDEVFPSYWSLNESKSLFKSLMKNILGKKSNRKQLVDVDKETKDAICKLIYSTFDGHLVGQGNDAAGLNHSSIKVVNVQRVENLELFELYQSHRKVLFRKMLDMNCTCPDLGKMRNSKGRVVTSQYLSDNMRRELFYEVNEHYLFHGAKAETIDAIVHSGIDPRLANEGGMFGRGNYAAERFTKSDQYTDSRNSRTRIGTELKMILARYLLGNVYLCDQNNKFVSQGNKLSRPPCMKCFEDKCMCAFEHFDSVMGDGTWLFREFVVYEKSHSYPEYVITYKRK